MYQLLFKMSVLLLNKLELFFFKTQCSGGKQRFEKQNLLVSRNQ